MWKVEQIECDCTPSYSIIASLYYECIFSIHRVKCPPCCYSFFDHIRRTAKAQASSLTRAGTVRFTTCCTKGSFKQRNIFRVLLGAAHEFLKAHWQHVNIMIAFHVSWLISGISCRSAPCLLYSMFCSCHCCWHLVAMEMSTPHTWFFLTNFRQYLVRTPLQRLSSERTTA